jgi:hypothetical protein
VFLQVPLSILTGIKHKLDSDDDDDDDDDDESPNKRKKVSYEEMD